MLIREHFLIVHGQDPAKWAERFGLLPFIVPCPVCEAELVTSLPFAVGDMRGLITPVCACGTDDRPYCYVMASGDLLTGLR